MRRILVAVLAVVLGAAGVFWGLTRPDPLPANAMAGLTGDAKHGEQVFWAGGCASCHAAKGAEGVARLQLGGGQRFATQFGTFVVPNISPDPSAGIGKWRAIDLANAMLRGLNPAGEHLYPAFPYPSYTHMTLQDVADLKAFLDTLPPVSTPSAPHELTFPFSIRRFVGIWKALYLRDDWTVRGTLSPAAQRGRYLVEALAHCGECHTQRNTLGAVRRDLWLAGAPNPVGTGRVPNITPGKLDWSEDDIATYLKTGMTPNYDSAGRDMSEVVENISKLSDADRADIAAYLKAVPAVK
jgi:mono/diheme cytochrome c family protein